MNSLMENAYSGMTFEEYEELQQELDEQHNDRLREESEIRQEIDLLKKLYRSVVNSIVVAHQVRDIVLANDLMSMSEAIYRLEGRIEVIL